MYFETAFLIMNTYNKIRLNQSLNLWSRYELLLRTTLC